MALKLGKCRLCLKLGDFYSIFTVDNSVQLAEMVMDCSRIKVHEGDGLPDKICSECIQKLSSAYIFKQQCERSDQELRRNYVPPPGFSTPIQKRQSSDSAFSSHTEFSNQTKPSCSTEIKVSPSKRSRKRSGESLSSRSNDNSFTNLPKKNRPQQLKSHEKVQKEEENNISAEINNRDDSDYDDNNSFGNFSPVASDSDEPVLPEQFKCDLCDKIFNNQKSLSLHRAWHKRNSVGNNSRLGSNAVVDIPKSTPVTPSTDDTDEEKVSCDKCGKSFKLKIMLKRHKETCISPQKTPQKELLVTLEPINPYKKYSCEMCPTKFKAVENLEKHMRVCHAAVLKKPESLKIKKHESTKNSSKAACMPCIYCQEPFNDYYAHSAHIGECPERHDLNTFECPVCRKITMKKASYLLHVRAHFDKRMESEKAQSNESFDCRMCFKKLPSQGALIKHLAAHVSNIEDAGSIHDDDEETRVSNEDAKSIRSDHGTNSSDGGSGPLKCLKCGKVFSYRKAYLSHESRNDCSALVKKEPPDLEPNISSSVNNTQDEEDIWTDESSQDDGDNTCDICEKRFSYKRMLLQHKRTKHNMSSGTKRANICLKNCKVKCLICDLEMKVSESNAHNRIHIAKNMKPRNVYTCNECGDTHKSCQALGNHIKLVHRLQKQVSRKYAIPDLADFCEVVVTKTEPLDAVQSHNGTEVPSGKADKKGGDISGFTCPICSKKMPTLVSLKRHVNWHSNVGNNIEKKLECFICNEVFRFQTHYKLHMREHYNDTNLDPKFLTCPICERRSKHLRAAQAHMNFHKQTRFNSQDYKCSICKRVFQHRKVYLSHMAIHYKRGESVVGDKMPIDTPVKHDGVNTCPHCGKVCDSEVSLKHHISWHKSKTSLFGARHECPVCDLQFTNKQRLKLHIRGHYEDDNGPFKCNICGKGYTDEDFFKRHVKGHNFDHQSHKKRIAKLRENKVKCPICERFYPDLVKLIRHLRRTHPQSKMIKTDPDEPKPQIYSCKLCAKVFFDEKRLQFHEEAHLRKPEFFKCKFCGKKTISLKNHNLHIKSHLTKKYFDNPLKCTQCDEKFVWGYDLHHHLRDVHGIKETWIGDRTKQMLNGPLKDLQCSICLKVLASKGNYERHIDYHNSLRCNYCYDYFSSLRFLEGHLRFSCKKKLIIGDTEPYPRKIKCDACYKAFHVEVKLDCHLRTQHGISVSREAREGKKDIVCDYCFKVFENEYALSTHKIYHRTVGFYGCLYCERKFNTITLYNKHKNHHLSQLYPDDPVKCEHCDERFVAFREMIYHMRDVHADDKDWLVMPKEATEENCNICNKIFLNLPRHMAYHQENRCKKCSEYFFSVVDFDNHLCAIDSDAEPGNNECDLRPKYEECVFCFKPFTRTSTKIKHDLIHKGSGSISCRFCKLKFKTIDAFNIHAFSHRSRKYKKKPLKCRMCGEKFIKYGPFMKHMKGVHKSKLKMHYRTIVKPELCVVCGTEFPNLQNHYRAHLLNRCNKCDKYFTSARLFSLHECDKPDSDPSKVFECDANLTHLINTYVPKDEKDDEKFHGDSEEEDEEETVENQADDGDNKSLDIDEKFIPDISCDEESQQSQNSAPPEQEHLVPLSIQSPIISDVLSLYQEKSNEDVIDLIDDDSVDMEMSCPAPVVTIDD